MYTLRHDDSDWPPGLDRAISAHDDIGDALQAMNVVLEQRHAQLDANGEGGTSLHLAVIDDTGEPIATADVRGRPAHRPGWSPWTS